MPLLLHQRSTLITRVQVTFELDAADRVELSVKVSIS
jgi:hypothetical protein